jgi:hypothetical protein
MAAAVDHERRSLARRNRRPSATAPSGTPHAKGAAMNMKPIASVLILGCTLTACIVDGEDAAFDEETSGSIDSNDSTEEPVGSDSEALSINWWDKCALFCIEQTDKCIASGTMPQKCDEYEDKCLCNYCRLRVYDPASCEGVPTSDPVVLTPIVVKQK